MIPRGKLLDSKHVYTALGMILAGGSITNDLYSGKRTRTQAWRQLHECFVPSWRLRPLLCFEQIHTIPEAKPSDATKEALVELKVRMTKAEFILCTSAITTI